MSNKSFEEKVGAAFVGGMRAKYNELCVEVKSLAERIKTPVKTIWGWLSEGSETAAPVAPNLNGALRVREETASGGKMYSYSQLAPFVSQAVLALVASGTKSFTTSDVNRSLGTIIPKSRLDRRYIAALVEREFKGLKIIKPGAKGGAKGVKTFQLLKNFGPKAARSYTSPGQKAGAKKPAAAPKNAGYTYSTFRPVVLTALQRFLERGVSTFTSLDLRAACATVAGEKATFPLNWPGTTIKSFKILGLAHMGTLPHPTAVNVRIIQYQFTDPVAARVALASLLEQYPLLPLAAPAAASGSKKAGSRRGAKRQRGSLKAAIMACFGGDPDFVLRLSEIQTVLRSQGWPAKSVNAVGTMVPNLMKKAVPEVRRVGVGQYALAVSQPVGVPTNASASTEGAQTASLPQEKPADESVAEPAPAEAGTPAS